MEGHMEKRNGGPGGGHGRGMRPDKTKDALLTQMKEKTSPLFSYHENASGALGGMCGYYLFEPHPSDALKTDSLPMVVFIPDASCVGCEKEYVLTQGWGGLIWAEAEEQKRHPSYVLVPVFSEVVVQDDYSHSDQIDVLTELIKDLAAALPVDGNRIYITGQSMGGMTAFYLSIASPDIFAAYLFAGCQWDNGPVSEALRDRPFFYIVSSGDRNASAGQKELMDIFTSHAVPFSFSEWSARDDMSSQDEMVHRMLSEGNSANFVSFAPGTTVPEGEPVPEGAGEHMTSFDCVYRIGAVRNWLFSQTREDL